MQWNIRTQGSVGNRIVRCLEKVMPLVQVVSNRPKSVQNPSLDPFRGPSDAIFHPGPISGGPGARQRPPEAENAEKPPH